MSETQLAKVNNDSIQLRSYSDKLVRTITQPLISTESIENIKICLKKILVCVGAGQYNIPTKEEFFFLCSKFKEVFKKYSLLDIELAIDLVNEGEITHDLKLYDKPLSIVFLSELMRKYDTYKQTNEKYKRALIPQYELEAKSENDKFIIIKNALYDIWDSYMKGEDIKRRLRFYYYDTLIEYDELFKPSDESKWAAMRIATEQIEDEFKFNREIGRLKGKIISPDMRNKKEHIKDRAKELLMVKHFEELKEMGIDLELKKCH